MGNKDNFNYEIVEKIAVLSQYGTTSKELNKVSYNGTQPKYDIRNWTREGGTEKMSKGVTLTDSELKALKEALAKI